MDQTSQTLPADLAVIGIDIGKQICHLVGFGRDGTIAFRRKIKRLAVTDTSPTLHCWHGGVPERAFRQPHFARPRL